MCIFLLERGGVLSCSVAQTFVQANSINLDYHLFQITSLLAVLFEVTVLKHFKVMLLFAG